MPTRSHHVKNTYFGSYKKREKRITVVLVVLVMAMIPIFLILVFVFSKSYFAEFVSNSELKAFPNAVAVSDLPQCTTIGKTMLMGNGSAVDAVLAMMICAGVVSPHTTGLGGGFQMTIYKKDQEKAYFLDATPVAPLSSLPNMFSQSHNSKHGPQSAAVPGAIAGYVAAHQKFGNLLWSRIFSPSVDLCYEGFNVNADLDRKINSLPSKLLDEYPGMRELLTNPDTKKLYRIGDTWKNEVLGLTLETIMKERKNALFEEGTALNSIFYRDLRQAYTSIEAADLANYKALFKDPVRFSILDNYQVYTSNLPGSGAMLALIIRVLEGFKLKYSVRNTIGGTALTIHRVVETFKFAFARRLMLEDDFNTTKKTMSDLTSAEFANEIRLKIDDTQSFERVDHYGIPNTTFINEHGSSSFAAVAPNGDIAVATSSINGNFGSFIVLQSTGILLNNAMDNFASPGILPINRLSPTKFNKIMPGKRPMTSFSPTIVLDKDSNLRLVVSGTGGPYAITSIAQTILFHLIFQKDIKQSIDVRRFHHQLTPNKLFHEHGWTLTVMEDLKRRHHHTVELSGKFRSSIIAISSKESNRSLYANADYRRNGSAEGF